MRIGTTNRIGLKPLTLDLVSGFFNDENIIDELTELIGAIAIMRQKILKCRKEKDICISVHSFLTKVEHLYYRLK